MSSTERKRLACFCYWGGERTVHSNGTFQYAGGVCEAVMIDETTSYEGLVQQICSCFNINPSDKVFYYNTKRDKTKYLRVKDQNGVAMVFYLNEDEVDIFVEHQGLNSAEALHGSGRQSNLVESTHSPLHCTSRQSNLVESTHSPTTTIQSTSQINNSVSHERGFFLHSEERARETITGEGQFFDSPDHFKQAVTMFAATNKFSVKFLDNSRSYYRLCCVVDGCPWKLTARCDGSAVFVRVIKFTNKHSHTAQDLANYKATLRAKHVHLLIKDKLIDKPAYSPRDICREFESEFQVRLSYLQAWRVKKLLKETITGPPSVSYHLVPWMCQRLTESIPNTKAIWTSTEEGKFKQLFVAYGCCIRGFSHCRPILFIDAFFLGGPCQEHVLSANACDADDGLYPLAYAVVSSENEDDWLWFLQNLKEILCGRQVVLVTNLNQSLLKSISDVFGAEFNSWCVHHLKENFSKFATEKVVMGNRKQIALKVVTDMAYAREEQSYQVHLTKLSKISSDLAKWVEDNGPQHWANAFFPYKRWDKLYNNVAESFDSWILPERDLDIIQFMKDHVDRTMQLLLGKQMEALKWECPVGPNYIEDKIKESQARSNGFTYRPASPTEYTVYDSARKSFIVKFNPPFCSCLEWQMTGIPCPHVCCALQASDLSVYDLVEPMLNRDTQLAIYEHVMPNVPLDDMPSPSEVVACNDPSEASSSPPVKETPLLPPSTKRPAGRPRRKRMEFQTQNKNTTRCGRCHEPGHNRKRCKATLPE